MTVDDGATSAAAPTGAAAGAPPGDVVIRRLEPADYDAVTSRLELWWGGRPVGGSLPRLFFDHFHATSLAAEFGGELVGFLVGFLSPGRPQEAYIHFVGVSPDHRRRGAARAMYERFFDLAREQGRSTVRCLTSPVNLASIAYHTSMGFEIEPGDVIVDGVARRFDYDGPGVDRVLFVRRLGPGSAEN